MFKENLKIGFAYDKPVELIDKSKPESVEAEYEDQVTIDWLSSNLETIGSIVDLRWGEDIVSRIVNNDIDVIFNITEAANGRNRESLIPALAEAQGIACTGSDAMAMGLSLDKYFTKIIAEHLGIVTPNFFKVDSLAELDNLDVKIKNMSFPIIAKPNTGGSSMGIRNISKVNTPSELYHIIKWLLINFSDSVLVEEFICGREFTVGLFEKPQLEVLPIAEILVKGGSEDSFYSYENKSIHEKKIICPADISEIIADTMIKHSIKIFQSLGCRDLARIDFRLAKEGCPYFLEINPLPGLSPYYSVFPIQAKTNGILPEEIIKNLIDNAVKRNPKVGYKNAG